jgi:ABC-type multidrug transport system ATPase subunit
MCVLSQAFSGRLPPSSVHGSLLFNGSTSAELSARGVHLDRLAAYVGQLDLHFPTLTVSETLRFAAASSVPSASLLPPAALAADPELEQLEAQRGDMLISLLGLDESKDVIVGNEMLRGVSGGQRKRVTIGEMLVGNARLLALDEVSRRTAQAQSKRRQGTLHQWREAHACSICFCFLHVVPSCSPL